MKTSSLCSVQATKEVAELAAGMQRLQAFIYVSTCYVNAHHPKGSHIEEAFYPLVMRSSERTVDHAELASRLAALPPGRAEKAVSPLVIITVTLCCRGIMMSSRFSCRENHSDTNMALKSCTGPWAGVSIPPITARVFLVNLKRES